LYRFLGPQRANAKNGDALEAAQRDAALRDFNGVLYCNDGDWGESCTALVEHPDGTLEILR